MASAVASNMPAATAAVSYGWLSPRVSFSRDSVADEPALSFPAAAAQPEPAISKDFIDFEFRLGGSATMLPADELFADGKLLPLRPAPAPQREPELETPRPSPETPRPPPEIPPVPEHVKTFHAAAAEAADPYVFSPKAPTCSSRWRELLGLKKAHSPKPSPSPYTAASTTASTPSRTSNSVAARSLKLLLLERNNGRASGAAASDLFAPLLRDSSDSEASVSLASSRFSLSSSSSSSGHDHDDLPRLSLDSVDPNPRPRIRLVRSHHHDPATPSLGPAGASRSPARRRPSPPTPPHGVSVDSPRMNSSGKIVFQSLERSSSSPAGTLHASLKSRSRVMDRSYSAGVRATPPVVLNVPVCSRPVFAFFKDKKDPAVKEATGRPRSALGRKTQGGRGVGSVSCRDLGN